MARNRISLRNAELKIKIFAATQCLVESTHRQKAIASKHHGHNSGDSIIGTQYCEICTTFDWLGTEKSDLLTVLRNNAISAMDKSAVKSVRNARKTRIKCLG